MFPSPWTGSDPVGPVSLTRFPIRTLGATRLVSGKDLNKSNLTLLFEKGETGT